MENHQLDLGSIKIVYDSENNDVIKIIDPIDITEEFKKQVWLPYMRDFYNVNCINRHFTTT